MDLTLKILTSASREDQFSYISAWSKMLSVCAQELRHGAFIWKQSLQESVHEQILSKPQGTHQRHAYTVNLMLMACIFGM